MVLRPEQLPHLVREARIVSLAYFSPVSCDSRSIRAGRSALAARRSSSMRALASAGGRFHRHPGRHTHAGLLDPVGLQVEELHGPADRNAVRKRDPHGPRTAHADRDTACAPRPGKSHLAQPGMRHGRNHRISTALIDSPCITTAESVRSNLIFSNRIRQRSSR